MTDFKNDFERDLVSIVAHDLKAPVAAVRGFIDLIQRSGELNEAQQKWLNRALHSLERMETLIVNVLNTTHLESSEISLKFVPCNVGSLITDTVEIMQVIAHQRGIQIETHIAKDLKSVNGDPEWLAHVLSNLISNAIKFNREGGRVIIRASNHNKDVRVEVQDTGIGISSEDQARVFERFYRARTGERIEGSGLGLSIVNTVIYKHGGQVEVSSELGVGSIFSFTLPIKRRSRRQLQDNHGGEAADGVDDNRQDSATPIKYEESRSGDDDRTVPE